MSEGLPLPWPFPWTVDQAFLIRPPLTSSSFLAQRQPPTADAWVDSPVSGIQKAAAAALVEFDETLPKLRSVELYLIRGLVDVLIDGKPAVGVIGPPEFLYVLDVGLGSFVGGVFLWKNIAYGDPTFPDLATFKLRSIKATNSPSLIFPNIPSFLIVGIADGTSDAEVVDGLSKAGLKDVKPSGFFATARCVPFREEEVCKKLVTEVPFVRYAEPDRVVRLVDFSPGWQSVRIL